MNISQITVKRALSLANGTVLLFRRLCGYFGIKIVTQVTIDDSCNMMIYYSEKAVILQGHKVETLLFPSNNKLFVT